MEIRALSGGCRNNSPTKLLSRSLMLESPAWLKCQSAIACCKPNRALFDVDGVLNHGKLSFVSAPPFLHVVVTTRCRRSTEGEAGIGISSSSMIEKSKGLPRRRWGSATSAFSPSLALRPA